ncbi:unnamed protein product [Paramecium octaurelia]|uniref:Uncharacterized protein n=1 Tax=Paramecium octaurelia TaxID=43137 RepID=A0A8S1WXK0_PAROT|nr:unnamed protein product [Paramecium octaurelia]
MKYLPLVMALLCLTALSRVETVQELLEQTKEQYHLEQDIDTLKSMLEAELGIKQEKETSNQLPSIAKDSISQSILLAKVMKSQYNLNNSTYPNSTYPNSTYPNSTYPNSTYPNNTNPNSTYPNSTYPNSTYNYTYQSYSTSYPTYSNSSNSSNTSNTTNGSNGSYPYSNLTYNYAYPSTSNSSSNSSSYNTTNQTSTINYTNGSSNYNSTRNSRYIPSRLQLRVRNNQNLVQGQLKNNTQNVTFYNTTSGTYESVVIYNNTEIYQNQTESYYYYYENNTLVTLDRQYDDFGNVVYRNFNFNYSLIVAQNSTNSNFNSQQQAFGTLVLTNQTFSGQFNRYGNNYGSVYSNDNSNNYYYDQNNQFQGNAQYSNEVGNYSFNGNDYGGSYQYQQNGSESYSDTYKYNNYRNGFVGADINQNTSNSYQSQTYSQSQYQLDSNYREGNNSSIYQNQLNQTNNYATQSSSQNRANDTISNSQSAYVYQSQGQYNSTIINHDQYTASDNNQKGTQFEATYYNSTSNSDYGTNYDKLNYNYTINENNGNYIENSSNSSGNTNLTVESISGTQARNVYDYDNQTFSYISGSNQDILNNTNSQYVSGPNTTVTTVDSYVTTRNSNNYKNNDEPINFSGEQQTTHTQSTIEQSRQQFNQLRGSKKQASGSWRQIETAELQQSNSMIIEEAINEINTKFNPQQDGYQFDSVMSVQEQIVSGINYKIYLNYSNPEFEQQIYEVIIYSIPWQNRSNQIVKSIRFDQVEN